MYKRIISKKRGHFVYLAILAAIFIVIYGNYVFAADKRFKSEEDLLDETIGETRIIDEDRKKRNV